MTEEEKKQLIMQKFQPKNDNDYKIILTHWIMEFHDRYMNYSSKWTPQQKDLFLVTFKQARMHLSPDIEGGMTRSIIKSS